MKWEKKGLIYTTDSCFDWNKTHAALPTPVIIGNEKLRVFYNTRDIKQQSRISYIDLDINNLSKIIYKHSVPVLELGKIGTFDDVGHTSSCFIKENNFYFYYINGYNISAPARYRISIGIAKTKDLNIFNKVFNGPIMDRNIYDPCGVATPFVIFENGLYKMWYSSFVKWEEINNEMEPFYCIKYATSNDGINWKTSEHICIGLQEDEGGIVRPSVVKYNDTYYMWYSTRKNSGYRTNIKQSYKIGFAISKDGIEWIRLDSKVGILPSDSGWDSQMIAYPFVFELNDKLIMLYNGNGFGQSGFGYAELSIAFLLDVV